MSRISGRLIACFAALGGILGWVLVIRSGNCRGGLEWASRRITIAAEPGQPTDVGRFNLKNTGKGPVSIVGIKKSCRCLNVRTDKNRYEGGEHGTLALTVNLGRRMGRLEESISVKTDGINLKETVLTVCIDVREEIEIEPKYVLWRRGVKADKERIEIVKKGSGGFLIEEVVASEDNLLIDLITVVAGEKYVLEVRPKDTNEVLEGVISFEARATGSAYSRTYNIPCFVR